MVKKKLGWIGESYTIKRGIRLPEIIKVYHEGMKHNEVLGEGGRYAENKR